MASKNLFQYIMIVICCINHCCVGVNISGDSQTTTVTVFCVALSNRSDLEHHCEGHDFTEYHTLAYYMTHHYNYFKSYQTYLFENGYHNPLDNVTIRIHNVTNLTLIGAKLDQTKSGTAVVNCSGKAITFKFLQSSNTIIENITFSSCFSQYNLYETDIGLATLVFYYGVNLSLSGVTILASIDEAFLIFNVAGDININDVEIAHSNTAGKSLYQSGNGITYRNYCYKHVNTNIRIINSRFFNNSIAVQTKVAINAGGLSIDIKCPNVRVTIVNVTMLNNKGNAGGNLAISFQHYSNVSVEIIGSHFEGGSSLKGGGMFVTFIETLPKNVTCEAKVHHNQLLHVYNTNFTHNVASKHGGGGVFVKQTQSVQKCSVEYIIFENVTFNNNSVIDTDYGGGIAFHSINFMITGYIHHRNPQFQVILTHCSIHDNYVRSLERGESGTGVIFVNSNLFFNLDGTTIFNNNATGLVGMNSNIVLSKNVTIVNNMGTSGGGMLLCQNAVMYLEAYVNVIIAHNSADNAGGGICVETSDYIESPEICFFQLGYQIFMNVSLIKTMSVILYDNHARLAGSNVFGGSIDQCYMIHGSKHTKEYQSYSLYNTIFKMPNDTDYPSFVSSPPRHVCLCQNSKPNCSSGTLSLQKFPGETFSVEAVLVGQFDGTVPGTVHASLKSSSSSLQKGEYVQSLSSITCNQLNYTISSSNENEVLEIRVQHDGGISGFTRQFQKYSIFVKVKDCPVGFTLTNKMCDCNPLLRDHASCEITTQNVKRIPPAWIGIIETDDSSRLLSYHDNCPFDYCVSTAINLLAANDSLSQDIQCAFNRTGVLCGSCVEGLSTVIGASECHSCSSYWVVLFIPFALIGIALLIVLILFNITIAEGTLGGVIFYCNIIRSNISIFLPHNVTFLTPLLKFFISLINLEIGISTCLFNGMNSYIKAWLDFAFPLYLWFLAGLFIILGDRCSWIVRNNAVKVLATLILLSYTRLLSAITGALQVSHIQLENGYSEDRWLNDGNIRYFEGKHIPLAAFAVILGLLLIPFALCLFLIQWLQKVSHSKLFSWINRLKPLFDAYTGPFTSSGRFWTGLLLLTRSCLLIVTAVNVTGDPTTILGSITLTVLLLLVVAGLLPAGLYRRKYLNGLEYLSLINLGALACLLLCKFPGSIIIPHTCVSIELLTFIGIIFGHFLKMKLGRNVFCFRKLKKLLLPCDKHNDRNEATCERENEAAIANVPRYYNEDREPLLAHEEQNITATQ